jgi:tripeptidyl-peptidase-1
MLPFSVALNQQNLDELDRRFWAVVDPTSPSYGEYLTNEEVNAITASASNVIEETMAYLHSFDGAMCKPLSDSLRCVAPVAALESMLQTEFYTHTHSKSGVVMHRVPRTAQYTFPVDIAEHVEFMTGLIALPVMRFDAKVNMDASVGDGDYFVVPSTLEAFYSLSGASSSSGNVQAAAEFQDLPAYLDSDVSTFISNTGIKSFTIQKKIGPFQQSTEPESELDVQYIGAIGSGATNYYYTQPEWMFAFAQAVLNNNYGIDIYSMSYGWNEADQCQISPSSQPCEQGGSTAFVQRTNTEFQKIGATGVTLLAATGDSGAHGRTDMNCMSPETRPNFPAGSQFVTAVGGTQIVDGTTGSVPNAPVCTETQCATGGYEVVASTRIGALITSGGGFSNIMSRPSYQDSVVKQYLTNSSALPPQSDFNSSGRAYPDVAALGHKYYIELGGQIGDVDGTSCSCPVFAGFLSLVNGYRISQGKAKVGFANPLLYQVYAQNNAAFNDIVQGDNKCTESQCCDTGFYATPGWDATSGLGTPNYSQFVSAMDALDAAREARM